MTRDNLPLSERVLARVHGLQQTDRQVVVSIREVAELDGVESITFEDHPDGTRILRIKKYPPNRGPDVSATWQKIVAAVFLGLTLLSLFLFLAGVLSMVKNNILFDVWVAFCAAASFYFIGGDAQAHGSIPLPPAIKRTSPVRFSMIGGIAVFVVVLLIMYTINH